MFQLKCFLLFCEKKQLWHCADLTSYRIHLLAKTEKKKGCSFSQFLAIEILSHASVLTSGKKELKEENKYKISFHFPKGFLADIVAEVFP